MWRTLNVSELAIIKVIEKKGKDKMYISHRVEANRPSKYGMLKLHPKLFLQG